MMSWPDLWTGWQGEPRPIPVQPLRVLVLGALAMAALSCRDMPAHCADCPDGGLCDGHAKRLAIACQYEAAYMRVRGIGSDGAMLEILGGLTP